MRQLQPDLLMSHAALLLWGSLRLCSPNLQINSQNSRIDKGIWNVIQPQSPQCPPALSNNPGADSQFLVSRPFYCQPLLLLGISSLGSEILWWGSFSLLGSFLLCFCLWSLTPALQILGHSSEFRSFLSNLSFYTLPLRELIHYPKSTNILLEVTSLSLSLVPNCVPNSRPTFFLTALHYFMTQT